MAEAEFDTDDTLTLEQESNLSDLGFYCTVEEGVTLDDLALASDLSKDDIIKLNQFLSDRAEREGVHPEVRTGDVLHFPKPFDVPKQKWMPEHVFEELDKLNELDDNKKYLAERSLRQNTLNVELKKREDAEPRDVRRKYREKDKDRNKLQKKGNRKGITKSKSQVDSISARYEKKYKKLSKKGKEDGWRGRMLKRRTERRLTKWTQRLINAQQQHNQLTKDISEHKRELLKDFELNIIEDQLTIHNEGQLIDMDFTTAKDYTDHLMKRSETRATASEDELKQLDKQEQWEKNTKAAQKEKEKNQKIIDDYEAMLYRYGYDDDSVMIASYQLGEKLKLLKIASKETAKKVITEMLEPGGMHPTMSLDEKRQAILLFTTGEMTYAESRLLMDFIQAYLKEESDLRFVFGYGPDQVNPSVLGADFESKFTKTKFNTDELKTYRAHIGDVTPGSERRDYNKDYAYYNQQLTPTLDQIRAENQNAKGILTQNVNNYTGSGTSESVTTTGTETQPATFTYSGGISARKDDMSYYMHAIGVADGLKSESTTLNEQKLQLFNLHYAHDGFLVMQYFPKIHDLRVTKGEVTADDFEGVDMFPLLGGEYKSADGWLKQIEELPISVIGRQDFIPPVPGVVPGTNVSNMFGLPNLDLMPLTIAQIKSYHDAKQPLDANYLVSYSKLSSLGLPLTPDNMGETKLEFLQAYPDIASTVLPAALHTKYLNNTLTPAEVETLDMFPGVPSNYKENGWLISEESFRASFLPGIIEPYKDPVSSFLIDNIVQGSNFTNKVFGTSIYLQRAAQVFYKEHPWLVWLTGIAAGGATLALLTKENIENGNYYGDAASLLNLTMSDPGSKIKIDLGTYGTASQYGNTSYAPWKGSLNIQLGRTKPILSQSTLQGANYTGGNLWTDRQMYSARTGADLSMDFNKKITGEGGATLFETTFGPYASVMSYLPNPQNHHGFLQLAESQVASFDAADVFSYLSTGETTQLNALYQPTTDFLLDYMVGFKAAIKHRGLSLDVAANTSVADNLDQSNPPPLIQHNTTNTLQYTNPNLFGPNKGMTATGKFNYTWGAQASLYPQSNTMNYSVATNFDFAKKYSDVNHWKASFGASYENTITQPFNPVTGAGPTTSNNILSLNAAFTKSNLLLDTNWRHFVMGFNAAYNMDQQTLTGFLTLGATF